MFKGLLFFFSLFLLVLVSFGRAFVLWIINNVFINKCVLTFRILMLFRFCIALFSTIVIG